MNRSQVRHHLGLFHFSFVAALLLMLAPWPKFMVPFMPYWLALMVAYWSLEGKKNIMNWAFFYGLVLDVLMGSLLGKHGMSLVALSFLITKSAKQLRITSFWQLMMMVLALLVNDLVIRALIDYISFRYLPWWTDLLPLISAALVWPWLKYIMDRKQLRIKTG